MSNVEDVKREMQLTGQFSQDALDELTQQSVDSIKNAKPIPLGNYPADAQPLGSNWNGNNFRIVSGVWYWDDTPGSMCGRTRTWSYKPRPGASYRQVNKCPQGYYWYEMYIPS